MADSPPPFEDVDFDEVQPPADEQEDVSEEPTSKATEEPKQEEAQAEEPAPEPADLFEVEDDQPPAFVDPIDPEPFVEASSEPAPVHVEASAPPTLETREVDEAEVVPVKPVVTQPAKTLDLFEDEPPTAASRDKEVRTSLKIDAIE